MVYDLTSRKTFEGLDMWLREANDFGAVNIPVAIIGNKVQNIFKFQRDLANKRNVSENDAINWARPR